MRAAQVVGPQEFGVQEVPTPEPADGEVRVRIEACGLCGSDLHFYHGNLHPPGHTPGHEMCGSVDEVGAGVEGWSEGDRVAVEPLRSCGTCDFCRAGRYNVCRGFQVLGVHAPGGFAEQVVVDAHRLYRLPADLDPAIGALTEPVAVSVHGLVRGGFESGQRVLVLGSGAVGLTTILAARALGAAEVWASARYDVQAESAKAIGADRVLTEEEASPESLAGIASTADIDLAVETVGGRADTLRAAGAAIRPGGRVSVLGLFLGRVEIDPFPLFLKEGTLTWSNCYDRAGPEADFEVAARLVSDERERLERLLTHRVPLERINDAFALASDKRSGAIKVSVVPAAGSAGA